MYTHGGLFEGIGVFSLAAHVVGMKTAWQVEIDSECQRVLKHHFPHATLYGDIHACQNLPYVDVLTAGFPCQPYSTNGKMAGENDPRYLVPEMMRVIHETRPRVCLFENVPAFTTITDGNTFNKFLRELAEMGYDAEWGRFRASDFGASHKRERWFCVAYAHDKQQSSNAQSVNGNCENGQNVKAFEPQWNNVSNGTELSGGTCTRNGNGAADTAVSQPAMGRDVDGFTVQLDEIGLPVALPYQKQHAHEPPRHLRTTTQANRRRVKQLANAIYAPVAIALLQAVKVWLDAENE